MKHWLCLILTFCLLLSGCSMAGDWIKEPVTFYYVSEGYQKDMEQVIVSEVREASGHRDDISYLLALYSMGPSKEGLQSPIPRNTQIIPIERTADSIVLSLSGNVLTMSDADFTLAGACLALTCMNLTDVQQITVEAGDKRVTIREDNLLLQTSLLQKPQEETK